MTDSSPTKLVQPVTIYVVYHSQSGESRELADALHDWFRLKSYEGDANEAGLPIWYRSHVRDQRISPEVVYEDAYINVLVVLVDDLMVDDRDWRYALDAECSEQVDERLILPVAVDASAYQLHFLFSNRNRLYAGDPAPEGGEAEHERTDRRGKRIRFLRRGVTEAVARELRQFSDDRQHRPQKPLTERLPPPLDVFLSHSKRDGTYVAKAIRDGLADYGQVKTWFDENELPPGYDWQLPMVSAAKEKTAALIAIVTDVYPTRFWCREEVKLAREPRPLDLDTSTSVSPTSASKAHVVAWTVQPAVAVNVTDHRSRWRRPMAQLAQVPHFTWSSTAPHDSDQPEIGAADLVSDVADRLLLESLITMFYRCLASEVAKEYQKNAESSQHALALLTWVPDPWTLTLVRSQLITQTGQSARRWILAYPGHGLRSTELAELEVLLDAMEAQSSAGSEARRIQLVSQERLGQLDQPSLRERRTVALSGGGKSPDVEWRGVGMRHVHDMLVRLTRRLMEAGARVTYGGTLSDHKNSLTKAIIDAAQGWVRIASSKAGAKGAGDLRAADLEKPPLVNYAAWPYYAKILPRQRAALLGTCKFVSIGPDDGEPPPVDETRLSEDPDRSVKTADALSRMRAISAQECDLWVVLAGKIRDWDGWMPGILEEVDCALNSDIKPSMPPPLIVGAFGGCAGLIADFLGRPEAPWPRELTAAEAKKHDHNRFRALIGRVDSQWLGGNAESVAEDKFRDAKERLETYRSDLHDEARWRSRFPAVDRSTVFSLLTMTAPVGIIDSVLRVLRDLDGSVGASS